MKEQCKPRETGAGEVLEKATIPVQAEEEQAPALQEENFSEKEGLLAELAELTREKRDRELCDDEVLGEIYRSMRDEVIELVEYAREKGTELDPEEAFHALLVQNFGSLIAQAEQRGEERAIRSLAEISAASPMALGGGQAQKSADYGAMDNTAFDKMVQKALRGELRSKNSL